VLYRDNRFLIINKPAGLAVHPGPGGGPSVEDAFVHLPRHGDGPWLAHRLDADTAGCLLIALRKQALIAAQASFAEGRTTKIYWAVVRGRPKAEAGTIDAPLKRVSTRGAGWRMIVSPDGATSRTDWRVLGTHGGTSWLELTLRSGRTHQARVHCAHLGCPIVGDPVYGGGAGRLHLMSRELGLPLAPPIRAIAPPPPHMMPALQHCGFQPD